MTISPFTSLKSCIHDVICLPCKDGTFLQLDFLPAGPTIYQYEKMDGYATAVPVEADLNAFESLFNKFFQQDAESAGIDDEIFSLLRLMFNTWVVYQQAAQEYQDAL